MRVSSIRCDRLTNPEITRKGWPPAASRVPVWAGSTSALALGSPQLPMPRVRPGSGRVGVAPGSISFSSPASCEQTSMTTEFSKTSQKTAFGLQNDFSPPEGFTRHAAYASCSCGGEIHGKSTKGLATGARSVQIDLCCRFTRGETSWATPSGRWTVRHPRSEKGMATMCCTRGSALCGGRTAEEGDVRASVSPGATSGAWHAPGGQGRPSLRVAQCGPHGAPGASPVTTVFPVMQETSHSFSENRLWTRARKKP